MSKKHCKHTYTTHTHTHTHTHPRYNKVQHPQVGKSVYVKVFVPLRGKIQIGVDKFHKLGKINTSKSLKLKITSGRTNIKCILFKPIEKTNISK